MRGVLLAGAVGSLSFLWSSAVLCQASPPERPGRINDVSVAVSFFAPLFFPKIIQDGVRLKEYICSDEFADSRRQDGDARAVDAIFDHALTLAWGNIYEALFISFVATMDHRRFGVKLPVVGALLWAPLTSEFPDEFRTRVGALPSRLYVDTPPDVAGDRDKLQHFFGSAFLAYTFESRDVAERFGFFVEWGEDRFIVDGVFDERDFRANMQGEEFGVKLLNDGSVRPSEFLKVNVALKEKTACEVFEAPPCGMEEQ
jgi:hypothetical protein